MQVKSGKWGEGGNLTELAWGRRGRGPANTWKHSGIYTGPKASICLAKGVGTARCQGTQNRVEKQETSAALSGLWRFPITTVECSLFPTALSGSDRRKLRVRG